MGQEYKHLNELLDEVNCLKMILERQLKTGADNTIEASTIVENIAKKIRKKEEGLQSTNIAEEKYKLIFRNSPIGIIHFDEHGSVKDCNDILIEIFGSSREKVLGLNMMELPDKEVVEALKTALNGKTGRYEGIYKAVTSGSITPLRTVFTPIFNREGMPSGGFAFVEDVSERHKAYEKLKESESRYRILYENNHTAMLLIDPVDGTIYDANPAACNFYGCSREHLKTMSIFEINIMPENNVKKVIQSILKGQQAEFYFKHKKIDGTLCDVEVFSGTMLIEGKELLFSIIHDISKRKLLEGELKKFRLGIDRTSSPVIITDINGSIEYVNAAFEKLYGYSREEVTGKNPRILKSGRQEDSFYEEFWGRIKDGKVSQGEIVNKTKDGEFVTVLYTSNPIVSKDGIVIGFIAIHDDITERKKIEKNLRQSLYEKEVLLSEVHHRVKNNLAIISAMMLMQAEKGGNREAKNKLYDTTNRIKAIANIHEHLYESSTFAKIDFTENTFRLIKKIVSSLQSETEISVIKKSRKVNLTINQAVYCSLVVNEVVTNIIKHAFIGKERGEICLCITEEADMINLKIVDNGNKLPDNFKNGDNSSLGMELIHILSQQLSAAFEYRSSDQGTVFNLTFRKDPVQQKQFEVEDKQWVESLPSVN